MKLTVQNLSNRKIILNSKLGVLTPHQTRIFLLSVEDIEKVADLLRSLETSGTVIWNTEISDVQDDRAEGATVAMTSGGSVSASASGFIYRPGGVASDNIFTSWATLYSAVSSSPLKLVHVDSSLGLATIDQSFDISGWEVRGYNGNNTQLELTALGAMTFGDVPKTITLVDIHLVASTTGFSPSPAGAPESLTFHLYRSQLEGDGTILLNLADPGSVVINLREKSSIEISTAYLASVGSLLEINMYDDSFVTASAAITGGAGSLLRVNVLSSAASFAKQTTFLLSGTVRARGPGKDLVLPINDSQVGTTEKLVASVWIEGNRYINLSKTRAMIGGSTISQGATLRLRPFSNPVSILCHFVANNSTLSNRPPVESGVEGTLFVESSDWYEIYLTGNGPSDTAVVTGLFLNILGG